MDELLLAERLEDDQSIHCSRSWSSKKRMHKSVIFPDFNHSLENFGEML
jgi:hypothetical protein